MPHIVSIELAKYSFDGDGRAYPVSSTESENVATIWVDWHNHKWWVRTNKRAWVQTFGPSQGTILTTHSLLYDHPDQVFAAPSGNEMFTLQRFGMDIQARMAGHAMLGTDPNRKGRFLYYTYFWRKIRGQDMTARERCEEMFSIACDKYAVRMGKDVIDQLKGLASAESLGSMGAILWIFAYATAMGYAGLVAALRVLCGVADFATNWVMYKPYWDEFKQQVDTGQDLDRGADALATLMAGLCGYGVTNAVSSQATKKAAPKVQEHANKFADNVRGVDPKRWQQAAEQGLEDLKEQGKDNEQGTKVDPGKDVGPERRQEVVAEMPARINAIKKIAAKFGFPPNIAEGYALLAYENGWTIFARTSKASSIKHHSQGAENVTGKSLFVQYKIDPTHGVIVKKPGANIEADFYAPDSYAAKQLEAIYYAENPQAPKGSFKVTEKVLAEFKQAHRFEFREVQMGGKTVEVLFHNDKMVISDVDLMGIYVKVGNDLIPLPQWMLHNDAKFLRDFINRNVGGVESNFHGQQDVGRNSKGQPFRAPDADENYAMFTPDLKLSEVKSTAALEVLYRKLRIKWPYRTYLQVQDNVTHWFLNAARKHPPPKRDEDPRRPRGAPGSRQESTPRPRARPTVTLPGRVDNPPGYPTYKKR